MLNPADSKYVYEYIQLLKGTATNMGKADTNGMNGREKVGVAIWRYVIEEILKITPDQALEYLDDATVRQLKLDKTLSLFNLPMRDGTRYNYSYVLKRVYPDDIYYGSDTWALEMFQKVAHLGKWLYDKRKYSYPPKFFSPSSKTQDSRNSKHRLDLLLNYLVKQYLWDVYPLDEIYALFANTEKADKYLDKYKLGKKNYRIIYDSPLDFLHGALGDEQSDFLYYAYKLAHEADEVSIELHNET